MVLALITGAAMAITAQEAQVSQTLEEIRAMIEAAAKDLPDSPLKYDERGRALPPWVVFPDIERYSIGWRMGSGEDYWHAFAEWYSSLSATSWSNYRASYPAPEGWEDFYEIREQR
jgi:hypothetical protein